MFRRRRWIIQGCRMIMRLQKTPDWTFNEKFFPECVRTLYSYKMLPFLFFLFKQGKITFVNVRKIFFWLWGTYYGVIISKPSWIKALQYSFSGMFIQFFFPCICCCWPTERNCSVSVCVEQLEGRSVEGVGNAEPAFKGLELLVRDQPGKKREGK